MPDHFQQIKIKIADMSWQQKMKQKQTYIHLHLSNMACFNVESKTPYQQFFFKISWTHLTLRSLNI